MIREIQVSTIQTAVRALIEEAAYHLPEDYLQAMREA